MNNTIAIDPTAPVRRRCGWCREPQDGRGPIQQHEAVTDLVCDGCHKEHFPELHRERATDERAAA